MRKFRFHKSDGKDIIIQGKNPMDAWEQLCDSLEDDYFFLKAFLNPLANRRAITEEYVWLNKVISRNFAGAYGPAFMEL